MYRSITVNKDGVVGEDEPLPIEGIVDNYDRVDVVMDPTMPVRYDPHRWDETVEGKNEKMREAFLENPAMPDGTPAAIVRVSSHSDRDRLALATHGLNENFRTALGTDTELHLVPRSFVGTELGGDKVITETKPRMSTLR